MSGDKKAPPQERQKWSDPVVEGHVPKKIATPEPAASLVVAAPVAPSVEGDCDFQVLMIKRSSHGFFGSLTVFPGGKVDLKADGSEDWRKVIFSQPAHQGQLARKFPESHNLAYAIGAVREAFEETGTLIIEPRRSAAGLSKEEADKVRANLADWRKKVSKTPSEFLNFCQQAGVAPAVRKIQPWSRICTPPSVPKRFDTRFFVTALSAPPSSIAADNFEVVGLAWMTPQEALRQMERKEISMIWPQLKTIEELATMKFADILDYIEMRKERDPARLEMVIPGPPPGAKPPAGKPAGGKKAKM